MRRTGFSVLELVIASMILSVVLLPVFHLFSIQRHEVTWANQEVFLHAYAIQRLSEEEDRLAVMSFQVPSGRSSRQVELTPPGKTISIHETISVTQSAATSGLWWLGIEITWREMLRQGRLETLALSRLVVNREQSLRLPIGDRTTVTTGVPP